MRRLSVVLLFAAVTGATPGSGQQATVIAFTDVHVIPMNRDTVLQNQTVIVRDGRIATIAPARNVRVPPGAERIDGRGQAWLIPGLADMHVHMFDRGELIMYLANGITTVRNLHGIPRHLAWRDSIHRNQLLGPRLFTSGPIVDGDPPTRGTNTVLRTREDVERAVAGQKAAGYDFIKVYDNLPRDLYELLAAEARRAGLPLVGHVPTPVGINGLLEVGGQYAIEHVEELLPFFRGGRDSSGLGNIAAALSRHGVWVTPTVSVYLSAVEQATDWNRVQHRPAMRYMNGETAQTWGWTPTGEGRNGNQRAREGFGGAVAFFEQQLIPSLQRAGVRLLAGTDAPIPAIIPGFSLVGELQSFVRSGLTTYEALATATSNPAQFLKKGGQFGTIEIGASADLVLLNADPLADIGNVDHRIGVMRAGRWLPQAELNGLLEEMVATRTTGR